MRKNVHLRGFSDWEVIFPINFIKMSNLFLPKLSSNRFLITFISKLKYYKIVCQFNAEGYKLNWHKSLYKLCYVKNQMKMNWVYAILQLFYKMITKLQIKVAHLWYQRRTKSEFRYQFEILRRRYATSICSSITRDKSFLPLNFD